MERPEAGHARSKTIADWHKVSRHFGLRQTSGGLHLQHLQRGGATCCQTSGLHLGGFGRPTDWQQRPEDRGRAWL